MQGAHFKYKGTNWLRIFLKTENSNANDKLKWLDDEYQSWLQNNKYFQRQVGVLHNDKRVNSSGRH